MPFVVHTKIIRPGKLNVGLVLQECQKQLVAEGAYIKGEYEKTTATWDHKPAFEVITDTSGGEMTTLVGTDDNIFKWVDEGTKAHPIVVKNAPKLVFQEGYVAKTEPRLVGSRAGGEYGAVVQAVAVQHPGTAAREFTKVIQEKTKSRFQRNIIDAVKRGAAMAQAEAAQTTTETT